MEIVNDFFTKGYQCNLKAKKIVQSLYVKVISIYINFVPVPLPIHYFNPLKYRIWITISSMIVEIF